MSGDGRDESRGGTGGSDSTGLPSRQVPSQAGPGGSSGAPGPGRPAGTGRPAGSAGPPGVAAGGPQECTVPAQREGAGLESVLRPPGELPSSDAELIRRMREGDDSAYAELFHRHSTAVRRYARTCCRDAHTADDLTAEVFARTLQAVRAGAGPEQAVRAYLLTTVRRVAAAWTKTARREQLVDDFAVFASEAASGSAALSDGTLDPGADVRAMHEAEQSLALQAFRSLPERWQAVLWHTTVEEESPSAVAPLFGLTANATAVLAGRAREGLKQAYLQAHVSSALTSGGDCARYADRLGAYSRGGLRTRAQLGLRKHLEECAKCRLAAGELAHVNAGIPALLPVAVIGWFAAGYSLKAAGIVAGGAAAGAGAATAGTGGAGASSGAGASGASGASSGAGASGASGASSGAGASGASGASSGAGASGASGASSGAGASAGAGGGAAASEGLGAPVKAGIAATVAVAAVTGLVLALAGGPKPEAKPPAAEPVVPLKPTPSPKRKPPAPAVAEESAPPDRPSPNPAPPLPTTKSTARPNPKLPPMPSEPKDPDPPAPTPAPRPKPTPPPPPPRVYQVNQLEYGVFGDHAAPEVRLGESSWLWQRWGMSIGGTRYGHGVTVHAESSVTIDLNRRCSVYDAMVGIDDLTLGRGAVRFSVYGDGGRLWQSPVMRGGDAAVPVHVPITGQRTIRLVVHPHTPLDSVALGDWARAQISCR
ncbi:sigma-70 family RNA polymerase sigma factor [Streptomyces sp. NBC_01750]|uniref:sigma-70 family RNA polymerase sigma factor n=1 Tax=Streptomyces sp. NBC_01750 TaxID=2975928 RepID=UPI002DD7EC84|nr:sigma-70 family RNA polymerase sigma factor [Streptomyces sp. NBC_01750]WSD33821.1 sigma-70 family RNA polymerase sigma factor [Streptomyces sp. NBC_01750]